MSWRQHEAPERFGLSIHDDVDDVPAWIVLPRHHFRERDPFLEPGRPTRCEGKLLKLKTFGLALPLALMK